MNANDPRGSNWRRWDLHIHTKGTLKNDQFTSSDFDTFCATLFEKALEKNIAAIGITDYFSIDNYKKVKDFVAAIDSNQNFTDDQKVKIKNILLIPNVELRMLPVTEQGRLVNIHCLFNPIYVDKLENDFFSSIEYSAGNSSRYKMNRQGMISLGQSLDSALTGDAAYKKGIETFVVAHGDLQTLLTNPKFAENTIVAISNSSNDGASGLQKHYDFFEEAESSSLEAVRKSLYCLSQFVFSGNEEDRKYFLGQKIDSETTVKEKCGSLKPCVHGSDAHKEDKLFAPDEDRYCWIKADTTFEGLKQVIYEPADRVFVGIEPPVLERVRSNKTKYIDSLIVNQSKGYDGAQGVWFKDVSIKFNKELVAIIGNKGSGKSAISDVIGVLGNTHNAGIKQENLSFLNGRILKFRKKGYAENFGAELIWEDHSGKGIVVLLSQDVDTDQAEKVKYLPQNYFENLTNDLEGEGFDQTLKSVIFLHLAEEQRLESRTFSELEDIKVQNIEIDLANLRENLHSISETIIKIEEKKHPSYRKLLESSIAEKQKELDEHEKIKPVEVSDPSKASGTDGDTTKNDQYAKLETLNTKYEDASKQVVTKKAELIQVVKEKEELSQLNEALLRLESQFETYKTDNREIFQKYDLDIDQIVSATINKKLVLTKITSKITQIEEVEKSLRSKLAIDNDPSLSGQPEKTQEAYKASLIIQQGDLQNQINEIKKILSQPEKDYQEYKEKLGKWLKRKQEIEGTETQLNTLKFYKKEKDYLDKSLEGELKSKRAERLQKAIEIFEKKKEIIELYKTFKKSIDEEISKDEEFTKKFKMEIDVNFKLDSDFARSFLHFINKTRKGTFLGASEKDVNELFIERDLLSNEDLSELLSTIIELLEKDRRETDESQGGREISDQIDKVQDFYDFIFSLEYLKPIYELKLDGKILDELSPGEKGTLLLVFYLMIDKEDIPLVIDQPEDNLDNKSVFQVLTHFIKSAKKRRQIIIVTHNPNLAVGADAEQIIYVELDKKDGHNTFSYEVGAIEDPKINKRLVEILEGTMPAFDKRKLRYRD